MTFYEIFEVVGLSLILFSVGWELFFVMTLDSIEKNMHLARFHYKLDQLHSRQSQLQEHIEYKLEELKSGLVVHGNPLSKEWNHDAHEDCIERVAKQSEFFRRTRITLFAIGSLLVLAAKIEAYSSKPQVVQQTESTPSAVSSVITRSNPVVQVRDAVR